MSQSVSIPLLYPPLAMMTDEYGALVE